MMMMNSLVGDRGRGTYYLPLLSLLRKPAERCTCGSFVRSLPVMELPSSQTPFCAAPKAGPHTTHTHMHTHTRSADGGPVSDLQGRLSKTSLAANLLTHSQTHTHIHTHILSLSPSPSLSIIAHAARTINESSTVNKKGKNKKLCGALLTVEEVEVEVGEEEEVEEE